MNIYVKKFFDYADRNDSSVEDIRLTKIQPGSDPNFKVWFGLVSLFNCISTLFRLFNAKAILLEEQ